ncbi:enoyl-CoA hydratase [Pseudomonas sp. MYb118]|uniref:enoyl-CoA hydratase n=1 Tax=Pseudomonas sp. MYb118 TaxID=1848720 RepID=UPI0034CFAE0D
MKVSETTEIVRQRRGCVEWVIFNRPDALNAMSPAMEETLTGIFLDLARDDSVKALVLTGATGKRPSFMAGADFGALEDAKTEAEFLELEGHSETLIAALEALKFPTLAAIAGPCVGGGALIAAACDVRLISPSARFGFPIARTVGNCLSALNYQRLIDLFGPAMTKEMVFSARLVDAPGLMASGAFRELVEEDQLEAAAERVSEQLTQLAPLTLWATKTVLRRLRDAQVANVQDEDVLLGCYQSGDFREGVSAFQQKRAPAWQGR